MQETGKGYQPTQEIQPTSKREQILEKGKIFKASQMLADALARGEGGAVNQVPRELLETLAKSTDAQITELAFMFSHNVSIKSDTEGQMVEEFGQASFYPKYDKTLDKEKFVQMSSEIFETRAIAQEMLEANKMGRNGFLHASKKPKQGDEITKLKIEKQEHQRAVSLRAAMDAEAQLNLDKANNRGRAIPPSPAAFPVKTELVGEYFKKALQEGTVEEEDMEEYFESFQASYRVGQVLN